MSKRLHKLHRLIARFGLIMAFILVASVSRAADVDGDGVDSSVDLDDRDATIGEAILLAAEEIPGTFLSLTEGAKADPGFATSLINGETYTFLADGTGLVTDPSQEQDFRWVLDNGILRVAYGNPTSDIGTRSLAVSVLSNLGIANSTLADAYIARNGDQQVSVYTTRENSVFFQARNDGDARLYIARDRNSLVIAETDVRLALTGSTALTSTEVERTTSTRLVALPTATDGTLNASQFSGQIAGPFVNRGNLGGIPGGLYDGVAEFNADGTGSLVANSSAFTWSVANDTLTLSYENGDVITVNSDSVSDEVVYARLDTGSEFATRYGFLKAVGDLSSSSAFEEEFLLSSLAETNPARVDSEGNVLVGRISGWQLNDDGTAAKVDSGQNELWYWQRDGSTYTFEARDDGNRLFSNCDTASAGCTVALQRTVQLLSVEDGRIYVLEEERSQPETTSAPVIQPRVHYYAGDFTQDTDQDGQADVSEIIDGDADGDGIPNLVELANGLNPFDPSDAAGDINGDGISNIEDFNQGLTLIEDLVSPVIEVASPLSVDATGRLTPIDLGFVVSDNLDVEIDVDVENPGPLAPGSHIVTIRAEDDQRNVATEEVTVLVLPKLAISGGGTIAEGGSATVELILNGAAPEYPVEVTLTVGGSADSADYSGLTTSANIESGTSASITITTVSGDGDEGDETITVALASASNAIVGAPESVSVTISEDNLAPALATSVEQNGLVSRAVYSDQGNVTVSANAADPNGDAVSLDWTASSSTITVVGGFDGEQLVLDPSNAAAGTVFIARVTATDTSGLTSSETTSIRVAGALPSLSGSTDTDGDGISDADEGVGDSDNDGIPDFADAITDSNLLPASGTLVIETQPGLNIAVGRTGFAAGNETGVVSNTDVENFGGTDGTAGQNTEQNFEASSEIFDFTVSGIPEAGASIPVVLPLSTPVPARASYVKYYTDIGWSSFIEDGNNVLSSATGAPGVCPSPGDASYSAGLTEGDYCVQLQIQDGGPNDIDQSANGVVEDPGLISVLPDSENPVLTVSDLTLREPLSLSSSDSAFDDFYAGASCNDDVDGEITNISNDAPASFAIGTNSVTFSCADAAGNVTEATAQLTITEAPVTTRSSGGGGGCAIGEGRGGVDPSFYLMLLAAAGYLVRRRYIANRRSI